MCIRDRVSGNGSIESLSSRAQDLLEVLTQRGARFHHQLADDAQLPILEVEQGLWELVWHGAVHADSFHALRSLFDSRTRTGSQPRRRGLRRGATTRAGGEGRWTLLGDKVPKADRDELAEAIAEQLLARWGVVFHTIFATEDFAVPWREVLWALRRLEARGTILGGRFVAGFGGEQYASAEAAERLGHIRRKERTGEVVVLNACDPLNLTGIITPGERVASRRTSRVRYVDGLPVPMDEPTT